jgi:MYXO-CTERM domain-containing protein
MALARPIVFGAALAAVLSASTLALAADYYFDSVGGNDSSDGKTEATAKKTLKLPTGSGNVVHLKRGSSWTTSLNVSSGTVTIYGCGERPIINGAVSVNGSTIEGVHVMPASGTAINVQSNSIVRNCDADGSQCTDSAMGIMLMGENNQIIGNYVHDFSVSQSGSTPNNSGGAEGIMVMASNNEIAFNSVVNCQSVNTTLGGFEGGCYEIVNGKGPGQTIHNVSFHHNYCEKSVGLWEGCSGNFTATAGDVMTNHGIIENVTVSYNISVDSMWLFLLQTVNTDFKNVVFANNTIIHTPKSAQYWDSGGGHFQMALVYDSDTSTGTTIKADNQYYKQGSGFQPGTVIVKNNIFIDAIGSTLNAMFMANMTDHSNNLFVPANASISFAYGGSPALTLNGTESKVDLSALALTADYRLTAASTAAIDKGTIMSMSASAATAGTPLNAAIFAGVFNQDVARQSVPCGSTPDIGAAEYCNGAGTLVWPGPGSASDCGQGGSSSTGGSGGTTNSTGGTATNPTAGTGGGTSTPENCNCRTAGDASGSSRAPLALLALFGAMLLTRRQSDRTR